MDSIKISFIIPLYNEEEVFGTLIDRMNALIEDISMPCEVVLIDDGSRDLTSFLMEELAMDDEKYQAVMLSRNFGHQRALTAGLDIARGEYLMILDADLQDPPEIFHAFYEKILEGYEVVYGIRKKRKEHLIKRLAYNTFYRILNKISDYPIPRDSGDFCMISRRVARAIRSNQEESPFIRGLRSWVGFKQIGVPYERQERAAGEAKYTLNKLLKLAYDGIFNFSSFPIKALSFAGIFCISLSSFYLFYTIYRKYFYGDVPSGFTALLFIIILFGGFQFLSLGILGEYLYRAFFQVKNRPNYFISHKIVNKQKVYD